MNGLVYKTAPSQNIYEERYRQYNLMMQSIVDLLKSFGYVNFKYSYCKTDPTNPTYFICLTASNDTDSVDLYIPEIEKGVIFTLSGNRWIPVFQFRDFPIFKRNNEYILQNNHGTLFLNESFNYIRLGKDSWPTLLFLFDICNTIEEALNYVADKWMITDTPDEESFIIKNAKYVKILKTKDHLKDITLPFFENTPELKIYNKTINNTPRYLNAWKTEYSIKNILALTSIIDYTTKETGLFDYYLSLKDILINVLVNNIKPDEYEMNDISKKRIRLSEWILHKLSNQQKYNIINNTQTIYPYSIMDVINVDQRRALDDSINPLSELSTLSRVVYNGPGGISKESSVAVLRNLSESYWGVISAIDSPSGAPIGVSQCIVPSAVVKNGMLTEGKGE